MYLDQCDVFSTWAFGTPAFGIGHFLTFAQFVETDALQTRGVKEQILFVPGVDETVTLIRQLFNRAFSHLFVSRKTSWIELPGKHLPGYFGPVLETVVPLDRLYNWTVCAHDPKPIGFMMAGV